MRYLTKKEVAEILRVKEPTIQRYVRDGLLPSSRPAGRHLFLEEDVKAFVEGGRAGRFQ